MLPLAGIFTIDPAAKCSSTATIRAELCSAGLSFDRIEPLPLAV